jgi:hypothetical protein
MISRSDRRLGGVVLNSRQSFTRPIFISHADEDSDIAHSVAQILMRRLTATVRLDKYFLSAGEKWRERIATHVLESELLILLSSRITANHLAPGVEEELRLASMFDVPVVVGLIRNQSIPEAFQDYQVINFGERGEREEAAWEVARFLLLHSSPFAPLGIAGVFKSKDGAAGAIGSTEDIANSSTSVIVIGHTLKAWLSNYGAALIEGTAEISLYVPASSDPGLQLLSATHKRGPDIVRGIAATRSALADLMKHGSLAGRVRCYELPVKPMFSITGIDIDMPHGSIVVDHYLYHVPSERRPHVLLRGTHTPLYKLYREQIRLLTATATPLDGGRV